MNIVVREAIVDELTRLVNGGKPLQRGAGICWQIQQVIADACQDGTYCAQYGEWAHIMEVTCEQWSKWTGSHTYPVPFSAEQCDIGTAYTEFGGKDMFDRETEFGMNRLELAQLLLDAVTDSEYSVDMCAISATYHPYYKCYGNK